MSAIINDYITDLSPKVAGTLRGTAKLVITDAGCVMLDDTGARAGDADGDTADVTLIASDKVFRAILSGDQNPVMAFMSGKLKVDGGTQRALKVSAILTGEANA
jgi:putative sterol carrier protein